MASPHTPPESASVWPARLLPQCPPTTAKYIACWSEGLTPTRDSTGLADFHSDWTACNRTEFWGKVSHTDWATPVVLIVCRRLSAAQMRFYTVERLSDERSFLRIRLLWARPSAPHSQWRAWHYRLVPLERDLSNIPLSWAPISLIDSQKSTARYKSISFALTPLIDILRRASGTQWMSLWGATQTSCIWSWRLENFDVPVERVSGVCVCVCVWEREREREREREWEEVRKRA